MQNISLGFSVLFFVIVWQNMHVLLPIDTFFTLHLHYNSLLAVGYVSAKQVSEGMQTTLFVCPDRLLVNFFNSLSNA